VSIFDDPSPELNITDTVKLIRKKGALYELDEEIGRDDFYEWLDYIVDGERRVYIAVAKRLRIPIDDRDSTYAIARKIIAQRRRVNARSR